MPVHPRACGEHACLGVFVAVKTGSPPRIRGTRRLSLQPYLQPCDHTGVRGEHITFERVRICLHQSPPARAGNTARAPFILHLVHPRVGGEHTNDQIAAFLVGRSPPHLRGIREENPQPSDRSVHPRVGGEHSGRPLGLQLSRRSPPRVRGTLRQNAGAVFLPPFTPARAGNTGIRPGISE